MCFLDAVPVEEPAAKDWMPTTSVVQGENWRSEINILHISAPVWGDDFFSVP